MSFLGVQDVAGTADQPSDDDLSSILGLSQNASQQSKLELQQKLANALRQKGQAQGQSVPMGSVFIPPSPLTTAMDTFDRLPSTVSSIQGKKQGDQLDADRQKGLEKFYKLWVKKGGSSSVVADPNDPSSLDGPPQPDNTPTTPPAQQGPQQ
jgi:hypothetical protein